MQFTIRAFFPDKSKISPVERLRSGFGALLGIFVTGAIGALAVGGGTITPVLIAPMGASAVLLFAVPSSPLAQPWPVFAGNLVAAATGVSAFILFPNLYIASAIAIGVAIGLMMALRCVHPPSGAIALTAVLGGPAVHDLGYGFILWPVAGNTAILLIAALLFNNLTGRPYPHALGRSASSKKSDGPLSIDRIGFKAADLDDVLDEYDQIIDIDRDDLADILRRVELKSYGRRATTIVCGNVMSRDVIAVSPDASISHALELLQAHHIKALPVTNDLAQVLGIVTQTDILDKASWKHGVPSIGIRQRFLLSMRFGRAPSGIVSDIMTSPVKTVTPETSISQAVVRFAGERLHYLPVIGADEKLVGIVSQSDALVAMLADDNDRSASVQSIFQAPVQ